MGRESICTACRKAHNEKPPCLATGKPCKEVEAGLLGALQSEGHKSDGIPWSKIALVGDLTDLEQLEADKGLSPIHKTYDKTPT